MCKRRIVFNNDLCDGSSQCWFLKERILDDGHKVKNCPAGVFTYDGEKTIRERLTAKIDACTGCEACQGHCPAARLACEEDMKECSKGLARLAAERGIKTEDGLFAEPNMNSKLNIYVEDVDVAVAARKTIEQLNKFSESLQLIELFHDPLCEAATVPYENFYKIIEPVLANNVFYFGIDRRVIYTHENLEAVKEIVKLLNIDKNLITSLPLLIVYLDGEVKAVWGHGEINVTNFGSEYQFSLAEEIRSQLRRV